MTPIHLCHSVFLFCFLFYQGKKEMGGKTVIWAYCGGCSIFKLKIMDVLFYLGLWPRRYNISLEAKYKWRSTLKGSSLAAQCKLEKSFTFQLHCSCSNMVDCLTLKLIIHILLVLYEMLRKVLSRD